MATIVVLDGYTLSSVGSDWDIIRTFGDTAVYDRTLPGDIISRARGAQIVLTNKCILTGEIIDSLPDLKYIGVLATGYNVVDLAKAAQRGIIVTNIPAYSTESVVQTAFGLIIDCATGISELAKSVKDGVWQRSEDFSYYNANYIELCGKTLGIIGYGRIGQRMAAIARAFGMKIAVYDKGRVRDEEGAVFYPQLNEFLGASDIVSLHCPLTAANAKMINRATIAQMKDGAILINTARGGLIDEEALAEALNGGKLLAAGLDVLGEEPPRKGSPLIGARNAVITPHVAWASKEARARLMKIAADNIAAFLSGKPINKVN